MAHVNPTAALLIIGDEILCGETQDSNSAFLCRKLTERGVAVRRILTVGDDLGVIVKALGELTALGYDHLLATGGIGPTPDDVTRQAVAMYLKVELVLDQTAVTRYEGLRGEPLNARQLEMCRIPAGAQALFAATSGAPGFRAGNLYVLPGVPEVLQAMWPLIADDFRGDPLHVETFVAQARESEFAAQMEEYQNNYPELKFGSYPRLTPDGWEVQIRVRGQNRELVQAAAAKFMQELNGTPTVRTEG